MAGFEVRCCASQRLHQARRGVHSSHNVCRLLLPPALQADTFFCLHKTETALLCFVISLPMLMPLGNGSNCPHSPSATNSFSTLSCGKFNLLLFYSAGTLLHYVAAKGRLEVTRLLVESKANAAARDLYASPPPSHHLSLTICIAVMATLPSHSPSAATKPTLLHTCAASALLNDAPPRTARHTRSRCFFTLGAST